MKVLVGMSGGVDSTAAALLLKKEGHEVEGVIMQIWEENPLFIRKNQTHSACYSPNGENIKEAEKIADLIGVKLHVIDCRNEYKKTVLDNFRTEYFSGRTPNPCIWCNSLIKFGALIEFARLEGITFDKFATGHYAKIEEKNGRFLLRRAKDLKKDQTYFLYRLNQYQLSNIIFPLADYTKEQTRAFALKYGLYVSDKSDSQDFYGGDLNELFKREKKRGNIVDLNGKILGTHEGIWNFTAGQRKGIKISAPKPLYVAELRADTNEVVVGFADEIQKDFLYASNLNWINPVFESLNEENINNTVFHVKAKIRSAQDLRPAHFSFTEKDKIKVVFEEPQNSIAKGQSVVLYDEDYVLGGGIIE
ncbi:MAG: tRNA 2-thiouridine(34) synthase MnmA [Candidatus Gastranaerophilales bacterium]|nr:tRNA 2-thiouridine(34) synthase MnmA [Candidatus Gastranaerophilales bacterium]